MRRVVHTCSELLHRLIYTDQKVLGEAQHLPAHPRAPAAQQLSRPRGTACSTGSAQPCRCAEQHLCCQQQEERKVSQHCVQGCFCASGCWQ